MKSSLSMHPPMRLSWTVWGLGALLYLIGFYQRVAPAVMTTELMRDFGIGAAALGNLSAFYFYSYVAMQVPTGIFADTLGPRKLLTFGAFFAGTGTLLFGAAPGYLSAGIGRLLIGGSVAVAWVCMLKLAAHWFPARRYATISGVALFCGIIGAVTAGVPLELLIAAFGWRPVMMASAGVTFLAAFFIWKIVRDDPTRIGYRSHAHAAEATGPNMDTPNVWDGIVTVFKNRNIWLLMIVPGGIAGSVMSFSGLWGVPYLMTRFDLPTTRAAAFASMFLVAWAVGGPVFGWLSDKIGRRKPLYAAGALAVCIGWVLILFFDSLSKETLGALLLFTGFMSGCMIIGFAFAKESLPIRFAGTVSGVINGGVMMGPVILQPVIGWLLDLQWRGAEMGGVRTYTLDAYEKSFSLMILWTALSFVLLLFTRETNCTQHTGEKK